MSTERRPSERTTAWRATRKVGATVVGGSMVAVGIPLLVLPGPGLLFIAGGMAVLGTEFPAVQHRLERFRRRPAAPDESPGTDE